MRSFGIKADKDGFPRITLNGKPIFLYGPLDQGYFPDGLYTPPSEEAMVYDIKYTRNIGCNMIRKHIKVEPLRWYYHCDRLGMIVWQDMPNGGNIDGEVVAFLSLAFGFNRSDIHNLTLALAVGLQTAGRNIHSELQGMVDHLYNIPSIAVWVPFNESWGQFHANETANWLKSTILPARWTMLPDGSIREVVIFKARIFTSKNYFAPNQINVLSSFLNLAVTA